MYLLKFCTGRQLGGDIHRILRFCLTFGLNLPSAPGEPIAGLIVPRKPFQAHHVADEMYERLLLYREKHCKHRPRRRRLDVADMPGLITVRCYFDEAVIPPKISGVHE